MRLSTCLILTLGLLGHAGCGRTTFEQTSEALPGSIPVVRETAPVRPLEAEDISLFLSVIRHLPGQQPPEFVESDLIPLQSAQQLDLAVTQMRASIRHALTAERQVAAWDQQLELKRAFQSLAVAPLEFANLMLRISCAWSAWQVGQERPLDEARELLDFRISQLMQELHFYPAEESLDRKQLLEVLEELVMLSEFVRLLEQVPPASLQAVADAQAELRKVLPKTSLREEFAHYVDSQSRILRAGYQTDSSPIPAARP